MTRQTVAPHCGGVRSKARVPVPRYRAAEQYRAILRRRTADERRRLAQIKRLLERHHADPRFRAKLGAAGTHAIVAALASGPRTGAGVVPESIEPQDIVANLMALSSAGVVRPVSSKDVPVTALNDAICRRIDGPEAIHALALSCGTAVRLDPAVLRALRDGGDVAEAVAGGAVENWSRFLAIHAARG